MKWGITTMRRLMLRAIVLLVLLGGLGLALLQLMNSRTFQLGGDLVARASTQQRVVALTFDDGPSDGRAEEILALLRQADVRATFFVIGDQLLANRTGGERLVAAGHELGNHSYSHQRMIFKSPEFIRTEIEETDRLIRDAGYRGPIAFRPPNGKKLLFLPIYLAQTGRTTVTWDIEPNSYPAVDRDAGLIVAHVLERVQPGSIILLHPWPESATATRQAIPLIAAELKERGYRFATVSELLALKQ